MVRSASGAPTTAGMVSARAMMAVCDVPVPTSVTKAATLLRARAAVSAGESSWATSGPCMSPGRGSSVGSPMS